MFTCLLQPDILDNPAFMTALESVISGVLPVRCAAEKYGIRETSLVAAVMWTSIEPRRANDGSSEIDAFDCILQVCHYIYLPCIVCLLMCYIDYIIDVDGILRGRFKRICLFNSHHY